MIKKIILVLIAICLSSCAPKEKTIEEKLSDLGYNESQISAIINLSSDYQETFLSEYNDDITLVTHEGFNEDKLTEYKKYLNDFDLNTTFYLVNNNIVDDSNLSLIKEILNDDYCILENMEKYIEILELYSSLDKDNTRKVVELVNCKAYIEQYIEYEAADISKGNLILVNKYHYLSEDYIPENLVKIDEQYGYKESYMVSEAYDAYLKMVSDAKEEGMDFYITSAYRSYATQKKVHDSYEVSESVTGRADTYSARPGFSEHQTGLSIDILKKGYNFQTFGQTLEAKWLNENAYKYGFILRYQADKVDVTGYINEPWHYRYVGIEVAKYIYETGITFDEYYAYFVE